MKINNKGDCYLLFSVLIFCLVLGNAVPLLYAASKTSEKSGKGSSKKIKASSQGKEDLSDSSSADSSSAGGQSAEKLLFTLNETLTENRKIRESLRDLQNAFEKIALEKSELADQVKKVEKLAIQRNQDVGRQVNELTAQLAQSKKELEQLQSSSKFSVDQKMELEKKVESLSAENAKAQASVKIAILPAERDQIVARMEQNDAAVKNAMSQMSSLDRENVTLKEQVIQSYFDLGNMFYDLGRYEEAVAQYLHVLEWNPQHAWAHHNLAIIYDYHLHRISDAIVQYRAYMNVKLASEEAREARMRLWDLEQVKAIAPAYPLKKEYKDYREFQKI